MGEYLGEHKNKPYYAEGKWHYGVPSQPQERNLLDRVLDIYRGRFDNENGFSIYNIVEVLKQTRTNLAGISFQSIDLTKCSFQNIPLGVYGIKTRFNKARVNAENILPVGHNEQINDVSFSHLGDRIVTASEDGTAKIWDTKTNLLLHSFSHDRNVIIAEFNYADDRLATVLDDNTITIWDDKSGTFIQTIENADEYLICSLLFSNDGSKFVTITCNTAKVWDVVSGSILRSIAIDNERLHDYKENYDGKYLVAFSNTGNVIIYDLINDSLNEVTLSGINVQIDEIEYDLSECRADFNSVAVANDRIFISYDYADVIVLDLFSKDVLFSLKGNTSPRFVVSHDEEMIAVYDSLNSDDVVIYDTQSGNVISKIKDRGCFQSGFLAKKGIISICIMV